MIAVGKGKGLAMAGTFYRHSIHCVLTESKRAHTIATINYIGIGGVVVYMRRQGRRRRRRRKLNPKPSQNKMECD